MLSRQESIVIHWIRVIALLLIITCHIMQKYGNPWAYVCNVGVQMFLLISGFLYGKKEEVKWKEFYISRIKKVYLPYILYLSVAIPLLVLIKHVSVSWQQIVVYAVNLQAFFTPIDGLNHLWFLSILMIGYLLTPLIRTLWSSNKWIIIAGVCALCLIEYVFLQKWYGKFTWVMVYVLGMLMGLSNKRLVLLITSMFALIGLISLIIYSPSIEFISRGNHISIWFHVCLSVVICSFIYLCFFNLCNGAMTNKITQAIIYLGSISYEIYLTHHAICFQGLYIGQNIWIDIIRILIESVITAFILHHCSKLVVSKL